MTETTPEHKLGLQTLHWLKSKGPDALERLNELVQDAINLGFGEENNHASEDTDPWLIPKGNSYMTCSHEHCFAEFIGKPGDLCDACKDATMGSPTGDFCDGCDHD